jgi:hypothetical protein
VLVAVAAAAVVLVCKKTNVVLVIARQHFGFLRPGQTLSESDATAGESFPER